MKTVILLYLNSLGLVLVLTQTGQPYFGPFPTGCKLTKAGHEYAGPLSVTRSGLTCQRWNSDEPHVNNYKNSILFPEGSAEAAGNKCRNPDNDPEGVWCYTTDPKQTADYCSVSFCDCKLTQTGEEYAGPLSVTRSGRTCQRWDSDKPHPSKHKNSTLYPEGSASDADNKCRNPDEGDGGVWCYTTDPNREWEYCNVDFCEWDGTSSSKWQTILLSVFAVLLILATGIILYLYRERRIAAIKGATITKNTAIPHPSGIYEDIGYAIIDVPLENVVNREGPTLHGNSKYEYLVSSSMDPHTEGARIPVGKDKSTKQSIEAKPYMDLAPDRALPPVFTTPRAADYLVLEN